MQLLGDNVMFHHQVINDISNSGFPFWGTSSLQIAPDRAPESILGCVQPSHHLQTRDTTARQPGVSNPQNKWTTANDIKAGEASPWPVAASNGPIAAGHVDPWEVGLSAGVPRQQMRRRPAGDIDAERQIWKSIEPFLDSLQARRSEPA